MHNILRIYAFWTNRTKNVHPRCFLSHTKNVHPRCFPFSYQECTSKMSFQLFETFTKSINEKSWMVCPGETKCSETLVNISGKCTMSNFHAIGTFLAGLSNILSFTFLTCNQIYNISRCALKVLLILCTHDVIVFLRIKGSALFYAHMM